MPVLRRPVEPAGAKRKCGGSAPIAAFGTITTFLTKLVSHRLIDSEPRIFMKLLSSRDYAVIDYQTMGEFIGYERLFRATDGAFVLHMSSEGKLEAEERIIWLTVRDAIS